MRLINLKARCVHRQKGLPATRSEGPLTDIAEIKNGEPMRRANCMIRWSMPELPLSWIIRAGAQK